MSLYPLHGTVMVAATVCAYQQAHFARDPVSWIDLGNLLSARESLRARWCHEGVNHEISQRCATLLCPHHGPRSWSARASLTSDLYPTARFASLCPYISVGNFDATLWDLGHTCHPFFESAKLSTRWLFRCPRPWMRRLHSSHSASCVSSSKEVESYASV